MNDPFRQYMFSQYNEAERDQLRERLIADQALSDQFREQENEWIDACAAGRLTPQDAAQLRVHLAATGQLDRLAAAAALARSARPAAPSLFPYAFAIAAVVMIGFGITLQDFHRPTAPTPIPGAAPIVIVLPPGALRDSQTSPVRRIRAQQKATLQLIYLDTAPTGNCRVDLHGPSPGVMDTQITECGLDFHVYDLPEQSLPGRYYLELYNARQELLHTYYFDVTL